jgi:hypothetical protein
VLPGNYNMYPQLIKVNYINWCLYPLSEQYKGLRTL